MEGISIQLDGGILIATMMSAFSHRIKNRGATYDETVVLCDRASEIMASRSESIMDGCARIVAAMVANGHDHRSVISHANAVFAVAGVEVADELYKSLVSERN